MSFILIRKTIEFQGVFGQTRCGPNTSTEKGLLISKITKKKDVYLELISFVVCFRTLKDTFNAFDADGSAELGFPEYKEAWKFLNRPGTDADIKNAFLSVNVDMSGIDDWNEFAFSFMGERALDFGPLADLEMLTSLLDKTAHIIDCNER